jgi:anti-sigma B factor antagonist
VEQLEIVRSAGRAATVTVLQLKGPFTIGTLFKFQEALRADELQDIILDLNDVTRIDSAALGAMLAQWAHSKRNRYRMAIAGMSPRVRSIFEITRTDQLLPIFPSTEEAEAGLKPVV